MPLTRKIILGSVLVLILGGLFALKLVLPPVAPGSPELHRLQRQGEPIAAQIEAYKEKTGSYPTDLSSAGIVVPRDAEYGEWKYTLNDNKVLPQVWFKLKIGDRFKNAFEVTYYSKGCEPLEFGWQRSRY